MRFRKFVSANTERLIIFASGIIVSAALSGLIEKKISWSEDALVIATIFVLLAALYVFAESNQRFHSLAEGVEATVRYVEEPLREDEEIRFRGIVFAELGRLVGEAQIEVLALAASYAQKSQTRDRPPRSEYLRALEDNIKRNPLRKFRYIRIHQIDPAFGSLPLTEYLGPVMIEHSRHIIELERRLTPANPGLTLGVLKVATHRLTNYIIIDKRHLAIEITNLTRDGKPYTTGFLFIEDRGGKIIESFSRHFDSMQSKARTIELDELTEGNQRTPSISEPVTSGPSSPASTG